MKFGEAKSVLMELVAVSENRKFQLDQLLSENSIPVAAFSGTPNFEERRETLEGYSRLLGSVSADSDGAIDARWYSVGVDIALGIGEWARGDFPLLKWDVLQERKNVFGAGTPVLASWIEPRPRGAEISLMSMLERHIFGLGVAGREREIELPNGAVTSIVHDQQPGNYLQTVDSTLRRRVMGWS